MTPTRLYTGLFTGSLLALTPVLWAQDSVSGILESTSATFASAEPVATSEGRGMIGVLLADGSGRASIQTVIEGGPAEGAGLAAGDKILSVNGHEAADLDGLIAQLKRHGIGDEIELVIERDGWKKHVTLTMADSEKLDLPEGSEDLDDHEEEDVVLLPGQLHKNNVQFFHSEGDSKDDVLQKLEALGYVGEGHGDKIKKKVIVLGGGHGNIDLEQLESLDGLHQVIEIHGQEGEVDLSRLHEHLEGIGDLQGAIQLHVSGNQGDRQVLVLGDGAKGEWKTQIDVECDVECDSECQVDCDVVIECDGANGEELSFGKLPHGIEVGQLHKAHVGGGQQTSRGFFFSDDGEAHEIEIGDGVHEWITKAGDKQVIIGTKDGKHDAHFGGAGESHAWVSKDGKQKVLVGKADGGGNSWVSKGNNTWFRKSDDKQKVVEEKRVRIESHAGKHHDIELPGDAGQHATFEWRTKAPEHGKAHGGGFLHDGHADTREPHAQLEELRAELKALRAEIKELRSALKRGNRGTR